MQLKLKRDNRKRYLTFTLGESGYKFTLRNFLSH